MGDFEKEIEAMNSSLGGNYVGTEEPSTEAPGTDAPGTEVPDELVTDAPGTDAPTTENVSTDAPSTEAPDEVALLRAEIELLKSEKKEKPATTNAPSTSAPLEEEDFIGDMDLDDLMRDPKEFNKVLNTIYKKAVVFTKNEVLSGSEGVLKSIPDIVKTNIVTINNLRKAREKFYEDNEDLVPFKKVVGAVSEEIFADNPDKTIPENLKIVANEVRKRLDLQQKAIDKDKSKKPPKLPNNKSSKRTNPKPETKGIAAEIEAMNKSLNN